MHTETETQPFVAQLVVIAGTECLEKTRREAIQEFEEGLDAMLDAFRESATEQFGAWFDGDQPSIAPRED